MCAWMCLFACVHLFKGGPRETTLTTKINDLKPEQTTNKEKKRQTKARMEQEKQHWGMSERGPPTKAHMYLYINIYSYIYIYIYIFISLFITLGATANGAA